MSEGISPVQAEELFRIVEGIFCDGYVADEVEVINLLNEIDGGDRPLPDGLCGYK